MSRIRCGYCGNIFEFDGPPPESCPACFSPLEQSGASESAEFGLVHQRTGARISFPVSESVILGRAETGAEVLSGIPQVSRRHCRIEPRDGVFLVTDLGSTNGTFLGSGKVDCAAYPEQKLENGDILYLGREPFLVRITCGCKEETDGSGRVHVTEAPVAEDAPPEVSAPAGYECRGCRAYVSPTPGFTCPKCHTWNE